MRVNCKSINRAMQGKVMQNIANKVKYLMGKSSDNGEQLVFSSDTAIYINEAEDKGLIVLDIENDNLFNAISNTLPITGGGSVYLLLEIRYKNGDVDAYDVITMPMTSWNVTAYRYEEEGTTYDVIHYTTKFSDGIIIDSALAVKVSDGSETYQLNNNQKSYPLEINSGDMNVTARIIGKDTDISSLTGFDSSTPYTGSSLKVSMYYRS